MRDLGKSVSTLARFSGGPWDGQFRHIPSGMPVVRAAIPPHLDFGPLFAEDTTIGEYHDEPLLAEPGERVFVWTGP